MSYFDDASLVMIPSGYKDQKVYSVKPLDGSGDLTFSRASSATRVASNGLIEKVRTNLLLQSNTFNVTWDLGVITATGGQSGYDGSSNAWLLTKDANAFRAIEQSVTIGGIYTFSVYAKANTANNIALRDLINSVGATFNLTTGTISATNALSASINSVGGGWYRCSVTVGTATTVLGIYVDFNVATAGSVFIQNSQAELGDIATAYIATTSAAVSVGPVSGLPRLDYLNSTCPRLLLEPQRTNVLTYSEQIDNADWLKLNSTIAANTSDTLDPAGYNGADKITDNSTNGAHFVYRFSTWDTTQRTASVYAKAGTSSRVCILNATTNAGVFANLSSGTISVSAGFTGTITSVGNGWYRITATHTAASSQTFAIGLFTGTNTTEYVGTGSYAYLWGAQMEAGAYATSYIPTLGTSVTRVADAASKTGISSLIGQTEGTIYWEGKIDGLNASNEALPIALFPTGGDINGAQIYIVLLSNRSIRFVVYDGTTVQASIITSAGFYTYGTTIKLAAVYKANDFALYIDGVQIGTDTSGSVVACSGLYFDYQNFVGKYSTDQVLLFKTRLSNSSLAELTSL
jgi:hypothetical protein